MALTTVSMLWPTLLSLLTPMIFIYTLTSIGFFFEACYSSASSRKILLIAYIFLIVLVRNIYWLVMIEIDRAPNAFCEIRMGEEENSVE